MMDDRQPFSRDPLPASGNGGRRSGRRPNEAAIFTAALTAFSERGFNGASMRDIATRAGTSLSNLYNYVPGKSNLLADVLKRANDNLLAALGDGLEGASTPTDRLRAAVQTYVLWSARNQMAGTVAVGEFRYLAGADRDAVVAARDRTQNLFTEIVLHGVELGEFGTSHPREAARNIVLLCSAFATWYRAEGSKTPEQMARTQSRLALAMVEADARRA